ncbi:thioesterase II family protein [Streptomyces sp. NPDC087300]|uniref:thioesterase II family protein n=1 Tax=Streptomyces sp. NPDC087300 TaxID=3365780 RepID=UPI00382EF25D
MTDQVLQDASVVRPEPRPAAAHRIVCLGFCGGGTGPYRDWPGLLADDTELALVCYPGREGRFAEEFATSWDELAADATESVVRAAGGLPYTLFGHSMGGWMAFDVAARLEARGGHAPERLIVSSCNAPDRGVTERDRFPRIEDADGQLLDWMQEIGLLPPYVVEDADLSEMAVELMRADILVRDSYRPAPGASVTLPVQVLYGADDAVIEPAVAEQWARVARGELRVDALPGGHFYTKPLWKALPEHFAPREEL